MRRALIWAILAAAAIPASSSMAQTASPQVERTYGLGLPRDMDILFVPDADYPDWPLRPEQADYADVSGDRMKEWVRRISAISLRSQADGNMYWGHLPGTIYDAMTMELMIEEFEKLGLETERVPHTLLRDWAPTFWEASFFPWAAGRSDSRPRSRSARRPLRRSRALLRRPSGLALAQSLTSSSGMSRGRQS